MAKSGVGRLLETMRGIAHESIADLIYGAARVRLGATGSGGGAEAVVPDDASGLHGANSMP